MPASEPELLPLVDPEPLPLELDPLLDPDPELLPPLDPDAVPEEDEAPSAAASGLPVPLLDEEQLADAPAAAPSATRTTTNLTGVVCMSLPFNSPATRGGQRRSVHRSSRHAARDGGAAPHAGADFHDGAGRPGAHARAEVDARQRPLDRERAPHLGSARVWRAHRTLPGDCTWCSPRIAAALTIPPPPLT
jgi:hypothetical protein